MEPHNRSIISRDPESPVQESAETYPSLNITPVIAVYSSLSILLGIMLYIAMLKILRQIRNTINGKDNVYQKPEMSVDGKSVDSR
jgi:hypothetical protein